jgi:hypothetical protein
MTSKPYKAHGALDSDKLPSKMITRYERLVKRNDQAIRFLTTCARSVPVSVRL